MHRDPFKLRLAYSCVRLDNIIQQEFNAIKYELSFCYRISIDDFIDCYNHMGAHNLDFDQLKKD